ncbi:MAG: SDH family Clp fold serine proteinase [Thermomicrobiales bacterium]
MPGWKTLFDETREAGNAHDVVRRKYLAELSRLTGRNTIAYYSGWLQKIPANPAGYTALVVNDSDKNGLMATIHGLDRKQGLDLILHTPGGESAATESLVDYLRAMFGTEMRMLVPQIALSAGTMIACAGREIVMGTHSSLGPIDPQIAGVPAHGIVEEFKRAGSEIATNPARIPVWQPIIAKYTPTLIGESEKAIVWATEMVTEWLKTGMFDGDPHADAKIAKIITELGDHALTKSHARHISLKKAQDIGLKVTPLEKDSQLQEAVLSVHHAYIQTLAATPVLKIIENHAGVAFVTIGG